MSYGMKLKVQTICDPSTQVFDRVDNNNRCPFCHHDSAEIILHDFDRTKSTFDDLWTCTERGCGEQFIMRTKRSKETTS